MGDPTVIASSFDGTPLIPYGVAVDNHDNVFVLSGPAQASLYIYPYGSNVLLEIPYSNGSYGAPTAIAAPNFNIPGIDYIKSVQIDGAGNLFVEDSSEGIVLAEIPFSNGVYGAPTTIPMSPVLRKIFDGFFKVDSAGNVFVLANADGGTNLYEIPNNGGVYGAEVNIPVAALENISLAFWQMDDSRNIFGFDSDSPAIVEIPYLNGTYAQPVHVAPVFGLNSGLALDTSHNMFVADPGDYLVREFPYDNGNYSAPVVVQSVFNLIGIAMDASNDIFVANGDYFTDETDCCAGIAEMPRTATGYGAPSIIDDLGTSPPGGMAVDAHGNIFFVDGLLVAKLPFSNGKYGAQETIASFSTYIGGLAVDSVGNVFVADTSDNTVAEIPLLSGGYGPPMNIGSGFNHPGGVAVSVAVATARQTSGVGKPAASFSACAKRQSPNNTAISLPQFAASVGRPRRISASSITSSWMRVARCTISMMTAAVTCASVTLPSESAVSATSIGRRCLPPPFRAYLAWGTIWGSNSCTCRRSCSVTACRKGSTGSTRCFQERFRLAFGEPSIALVATFDSAASIRSRIYGGRAV